MLRIVARLRRRARTMPAQVALHQRDAGALHRHVGAGAHRDADVGLRQRRRVVDAVAGHGDHAALGLQALDDRRLLLGQHLGLDLVDAHGARDGLGGRAAVAGQHHDAQPLVVQRRDRLRRRRLDADRPRRPSPRSRPSTATNITVSPSRRSSSAARPASPVPHAHLGQQRRVADRDACGHPPCPTTPLPVIDSEVGDLGPVGHRRSSRAAHDGRRQRMLAAASRGSRPAASSVGLVDRRRGGSTVVERRLALGQRAGLVDDERVDLLQHLERLGVPDQHADLRRRAPCRP